MIVAAVQIAPDLVFELMEELQLVVVCQTATNPSDVEWRAYVAAVKAFAARHDRLRFLVMTDGGHPNAKQQAYVGAELGAVRWPAAIVSASVALRFVAAALNLFNSEIKCFSPLRCDEAFAHIELSFPERQRVEAMVERLYTRLARPSAHASS